VRRLLLKWTLLAGMTACAALPALAQATTPLSFVVITTTTVDETRAAWEPFFADMRAATGIAIEGFYAPSYSAAIDALVSNRSHLGWLSSKAALDCIERANVEVFGQLVDSASSPGYRSIVIARRDAPVASIDQLLSRPRSFGFAMGEVSSTSGHAMPSYALFVPRGIRPDEHFVPLIPRTRCYGARTCRCPPAPASPTSCSRTASRRPRSNGSSRCSTWPASSPRPTSS
jgi:phosphonate transport system substrate-binding protein